MDLTRPQAAELAVFAGVLDDEPPDEDPDELDELDEPLVELDVVLDEVVDDEPLESDDELLESDDEAGLLSFVSLDPLLEPGGTSPLRESVR